MIAWERTADGRNKCPSHGHVFTDVEYCPDCPSGGGEAKTASRPSEEAAEADEGLCRKVRDEILALARGGETTADKNESDTTDGAGLSTIAKLYDCALKWHRAAMEERMKRGDKDFAAWLVEEKRRLLDRGASH